MVWTLSTNRATMLIANVLSVTNNSVQTNQDEDQGMYWFLQNDNRTESAVSLRRCPCRWICPEPVFLKIYNRMPLHRVHARSQWLLPQFTPDSIEKVVLDIFMGNKHHGMAAIDARKEILCRRNITFPTDHISKIWNKSEPWTAQTLSMKRSRSFGH